MMTGIEAINELARLRVRAARLYARFFEDALSDWNVEANADRVVRWLADVAAWQSDLGVLLAPMAEAVRLDIEFIGPHASHRAPAWLERVTEHDAALGLEALREVSLLHERMGRLRQWLMLLAGGVAIADLLIGEER